ncbi:serine/threonine protein kinase [Ktedonobacter racemifer]|uniref:non-specific serine/threonine protein kinase n=1 Tax=Ktedonobacter racemifer DSM 44963 TaxID=485913 RepID=D6TIH0_KTERA|nr:serine/threonine-protein kinase [Ktedonobacter racemifer]EFH89227.1 serine/threonine protein kinase [Ktedonobacter racemifer DSM 44963]
MKDVTGTTLNGYYLFRRLAVGQVADVYCARSAHLEEGVVAVKVFRPGYALHSLARRYFLSESRKIMRFQQEHILPLLAYGEEHGLLYMVTPFIVTGTLDDLLGKVGGRFSTIQALSTIQQVCRAVQYAHEHEVLHGNLKPSNIFVSADGRMLLADFGIACGYDERQQSLTCVGWGSAAYAAPEQSLGVLRRSSDIYALGVLLFRLLTGHLPFVGETPSDVLLKQVREAPPALRSFDPTISSSVEQVVLRALRKRAEERFASAHELSLAFQQAVMSERVVLPLSPLLEPAPSQPQERCGHRPFMAPGTLSQPVTGFQCEEQSVEPAPILRKHEATGLLTMAKPVQESTSPVASPQDILTATPAENRVLASAQALPAPQPPDPAEDMQARFLGLLWRQWLALLVVVLLLLGLVGALLSSFYFPNG